MLGCSSASATSRLTSLPLAAAVHISCSLCWKGSCRTCCCPASTAQGTAWAGSGCEREAVRASALPKVSAASFHARRPLRARSLWGRSDSTCSWTEVGSRRQGLLLLHVLSSMFQCLSVCQYSVWAAGLREAAGL